MFHLAAMLTLLPFVWAVESHAEDRIPGYAPPREPRADAPAVSALRRFTVSGMASADNVALTASADDASRRLESLIGFSLPFSRHELIRIVTETDDALGHGRVIKGQGWADRQLVQRLIVINPGRADQEDILEGLCWLLLNRLVVARQDFVQRTTKLGAVPDWLAVGIAQNLYPALRARNGSVISRRWMQGSSISFAEILELDYLPEGRWGEKAASGLAVGWLLAQPRSPALMDYLFKQIAAGETVTMPLLVAGLGNGMTPLKVEKEWELWIAQQTKVIRQWGGATPARVAELQELLLVRPMELGFPIEERMPVELTLEELIPLRREPWVLPLATLLSLRVRGLGIGEGEAFRAVVKGFGEFFDALAQSVSPGFMARLLRRVPSERRLAHQLASARERQEAFLSEQAADAPVEEVVIAPASEIERFMPRAERLRLADEIRRERRR